MQPKPIYAIGDIHGQLAMLENALALIAADGGPDAEIVFLGDYTDRGPDSKGVINALIAGQNAGKPWTFIKGNHDKMFLDFVTEGIEHDPHVKSGISWVNPRLGGEATLASYGIAGTPTLIRAAQDDLEALDTYSIGDRIIDRTTLRARVQDAVPVSHIAFLQNLTLLHETDHHIFVHAGLRPGVALADQDPRDLMWIRDPFLTITADFGKLVIHGHTALNHPQHHGNRVNLDGGAGFGNPLIPAVFEGRDCWLLTPAGRQPLRALHGS